MALDRAALGDDRVHDLRLPADAVRRADGALGADRPLRVIEIDERGREHIHVRVPEADDRADVAPVALKPVRQELFPGGEHLGDDVLAEVLVGVGVGLVLDQIPAQHLPVEDVDAHARKVALRVGGLFLEFVDKAVRPDVHDAEALRLIHRHLDDRDRAGSACLLVRAEHLVIVHFVHMVAREDEHAVGVIHLDEVHVLIDGVGRAGKPRPALPRALIRGQDVHAAVDAVEVPCLAAADVAVEQQGLVLCEHTDGVDAGVGAVGQRKVDDAVLAAERETGLGDLRREGVQPRALPAREQHGDTVFFQGMRSSFSPVANRSGASCGSTGFAQRPAAIGPTVGCGGSGGRGKPLTGVQLKRLMARSAPSRI